MLMEAMNADLVVRLWVVMFACGLMGALLYGLLAGVQRRLVWWRSARCWTRPSCRLMAALLVTLGEALGGYALGSMLGLSLAVALLLVAPLERVVMPLAVALNAVPTVAYAPLFLIWFGLGAASKIALVALAVGFTMLVNALHGLKQTDSAAVDLMRSFGAGRLKIVWRLRLPVALPSVVTALRISVPRSVIVAIVGEMLGAYAGLGRMIYESTQQVDLLSVWSAVLVASAASMVFFCPLVWIDQKLVWWR